MRQGAAKFYYEEDAKRRAPVVSLKGLLWKADHRPEDLTEAEEAKLGELLEIQLADRSEEAKDPFFIDMKARLAKRLSREAS
jgi:hypothetical protein